MSAIATRPLESSRSGFHQVVTFGTAEDGGERTGSFQEGVGDSCRSRKGCCLANGRQRGMKNDDLPLHPRRVWSGAVPPSAHTPPVYSSRLESSDLVVLGPRVQLTWKNVVNEKEAIPERRLAQLLAEKLIAVMVL